MARRLGVSFRPVSIAGPRRRSVLPWSVVALCAIALLCRLVLLRSSDVEDSTILTLDLGSYVALVLALVLAVLVVKGVPAERRALAGVVPASLVLGLVVLLASSYADVSIALEALLHPPTADASRTSIALGPGGQDIRLSGELRAGASTQLSELLDAHPDIKRIHLTSEGGLADEGQALGDVIAAHGLVTFVPDYCVSACTLAFVRGRERLAMSGARLGFHGPYEEGLFGSTFQDDSAAQRAAYVAAGVRPDFVDRALKVPGNDLWEPELTTLIAAHVVTGVVDRFRFPDSNLDGDPTIEGARAVILRSFPLMKAFEARSPGASNMVAAWYLDAYQRRMSEGRISEDIHTIVGSAVDVAMAGADDATLAALARFLAAAMDSASEDCATIGTTADLQRAEAVLERTGPGADVTALALLRAALTAPRGASASPSDGAPETSSEGTAPIAIGLQDGHAACNDVRRAYAEALRQPVPKIAALVRPLLQVAVRRSATTLATFAPKH